MGNPVYKRVMLKLSGEAFAGGKGFGIDLDVVEMVAEQIKSAVETGVEVAVVVGGGNIWRGVEGSKRGMDRAQADYMGMLATVINALALQDALERLGIETRVQTAIEMRQVAEPYIRRRGISHLQRGRVVIFASGTGNPYFSTDTTAALRAAEMEAEVILMAKRGVDGVYSADPRQDQPAHRYERIGYMDVLNQGLAVMDATAVSLCMDNRIPIIVFNFNEPESIIKAVMGEPIGTIVGGEVRDRTGQ